MQTQQLPSTQPPSPPPAPADWRELRQQERMARRDHFHEAGVPVWGVLLVGIGVLALLSNFGLSLGWLFGLALGSWFVYLGVRPVLAAEAQVAAGAPINWWLVGIGLLVGLGSISTSFTDRLVFPAVLIIVGLGIIGQRAWTRQPPPQ